MRLVLSITATVRTSSARSSAKWLVSLMLGAALASNAGAAAPSPALQSCPASSGATCDAPPTAQLQARANVGSAQLTWTTPAGASTFNIYVSSARNCDVRNYTKCPDGALLINAISPHTVTGLANGRAYFFRVETVFKTGTRTLSNETGARPNVLAFNAGVEKMAAAPDGSAVYLGGQFTNVGVTTGGAVPLDAVTAGLVSADFPLVDGAVSKIIPDGAGGWYLGGTFQHVGALARSNLAHILADGRVDASFAPIIDSGIQSLALVNSTLYIGGVFSNVNGQARLRLAALSSKGDLLSWNPNSDSRVRVWALAAAGSTVYVGSDILQVTAGPRGSLAAINVNGATSWSVNTDGPVFALGLGSDGTLYACGGFGRVGGVVHSRVAALRPDGTVLPWNPSLSSDVRALAVAGNVVYLGGDFAFANNVARNRLAAVRADTGELLPWNPSVTGSVYSLAVSGNTIYVGGFFRTVAGLERLHGAAIDATGALKPWNPRAGQAITALAVAGNTVYAGGQFMAVDVADHSRLAAVDVNGALLPWNPRADAPINAIVAAGNAVYVGGLFERVGPNLHRGLAAIGTDGSVIESFNPGSDPALNGGVTSLVSSLNMLYVGGSFPDRLAAYFKVDSTISPGAKTDWRPPPINGVVNALTSDGVTIYAGGDFTVVGPVARQYLVAFSTALNQQRPELLAWQVDANAPVQAMATFDQTYVAGPFTTLGNGFTGNLLRNHFGRMNGAGGVPESAAMPDRFVSSFAFQGDTVFVGGDFATFASGRRLCLAAVHTGRGELDFNFHPEVTSSFFPQVQSLAIAGGRLFVGGSYEHIDGKLRLNFAILNLDGTVVE